MELFGTAGAWPDRTPPARAGCHAPLLAREGQLTVALQGGPVWLAGREYHTHAAEEILQAYRSRGQRFLEGLAGRFALAIVDDQAGSALLAVDRMGIERLTYVQCGDGIAFGSSATEVARSAGVGDRLRLQGIYDFLLLHMVPAPETIYEGVHKLRPGSCAIFEHGQLRIERYWNPAFADGGADDLSQLQKRLHDGLRSAVGSCQPDAQTGAFLSGGLDSTTIAGLLGQVGNRRAHTFSIGFGVDAYNELEYAHVAARHFDLDAAEYAVTPDDVVDSFSKIAAAFDEPFGNSSAVPTYHCARLAARHGVTHLLAGDGGDELFGGNERYARQKIFEFYGRIPGPLRRGLIEPLTSMIGPDSRITPLRKLRSYVDQARIPMPERLESWNYMYRADLRAMLESDFLAAIDPRAPLQAMTQTYASGSGSNLLQRMLFFDWQYTLSDNDLRKVGTMCALAGVRVSYPMLDPRVIDVSLQIPARQMNRGLELRSFFKQSMSGFLPPAIIAKSKHGFGLPFGVWLKTHPRLQELIDGLLSDFAGRGIVRPGFLTDLRNQHRDGHASYFGYAIWDLAMLEAWLQAQTSFRKPLAPAA